MGQERAVYPLTSPQRDVWVHQMLHPTLPLYNIGCYTQINGAVDPALFKSAIEIVVRRHDSLRTLFLPGTEGLPKQIFLKDMAVTVPLHDFSSVRDPYAAALIWMKQQFVRPFSLFKAPLFEYAMLKVNARCYLWYYKYHHLIVDGWSASLLVRSVAETYTQLINGRKPSLEAPSYAAFVQDDLAYRKSKRYEASRCYWKNQYTSLPDPLFTPRDGYRLLPKTTPSNHLTLCLERSRFDRLKTLAANYKASVFHVLLGALYVYFTRTAQIEEFVVGLPALNRSGPQLKKTCGLFVGTNAARLRFGADLSFIDLVRDIGSMLKKNYRHQRFPISKLNQEVGIHQAGRKQLFDIILSYEKFDFDALFDSATSHTKTLFHGHEQTPLMICVHEHHDDGDVALDWVFNLAFFDPFEIEQIQARFALILEQVLDRFDMPVSALPLLTEADRRRLLALHRNTDEHERSSSTILDLFRQQAGESPDRTAMVFRGERITYGELNIRTNRLARHLAELRVRAEDRVGICVDRSLDVVIGPWGIMKAGGAYVPLDPDLPLSRMSLMLDEAGVDVLLTQSHLRERLSPLSPTLVCLDQWEPIARCSGENLSTQVNPDSPAYVIYTSGSTGRPKGVMVAYRGLTNLVRAQIQSFAIQPEDRVLHYVSISFDVAIGNIGMTLCRGAVLHVVPQEMLVPEEGLSSLLRDYKITHAQIPGSILTALPAEKLPDLRVIITGGEVCPPELVAKWSEGRRFFNIYGPTEATIGVTIAECQNDGKTPPIGKPIAGAQIYLLDAQRRPTPPGVPGELCIAGICLAAGYLGRPDLTAEKFPEVTLFGKTQRIYTTGDLARLRPDGNLEFLGRIDHQVKLRGYRIELSEIELTLTRHQAVNQAVVVLREEGVNPHLAAFVTPADPPAEGSDSHTLSNALRSWLLTRLPEYMAPTTFTALEAMPLSAGDKVDRKGLQAWELSSTHGAFQAPRDDLERRLQTIWEDVLEVNPIGIDDNFFELGGQSLSAIRLMSLIEQQFDRRFSLATLFENATIEQLAAALRRRTVPPSRSPLVAIQTEGNKPPLFCVHPVEGDVWCYRELSRQLGMTQPLYGIQAFGLEADQAPYERVEEMAAAYLSAVEARFPEGPYLFAGWSIGGLIAFEMARQGHAQGHRVALLALFDTVVPSRLHAEPKKHVQFLVDLLAEEGISLSSASIENLCPEEQLTRVIDHKLRAEGRLPGMEPGRARRLAEVHKRNIEAAHGYTPQPYDGKIVLFQATERRSGASIDLELFWKDLAEQGLEIVKVPGTHRTMLTAPHVQTLAARLKAYLQ